MPSPLVFNVVTLLQEPVGSTRQYDVADSVRVEGVDHQIAGHARFDRTPRGILVRAAISGEASGECSRCLRPATQPVDLTMEEEYIPTVDLTTGARVEAPEGEPDLYRITAQHELDLREAITQYWAMALPMAPLCREDCPGICPSCGSDLAAGHACAEPVIDPRWSKLARLREN